MSKGLRKFGHAVTACARMCESVKQHDLSLTQNQEATHSRNVSSVGLLLAKFAEWNGLLRNL